MAFHKARVLQEAEKSVAQGKTAQAIRLYLEIIENDPSDVYLLNTVGDLYIRERNVAEGVKAFQRLAEAYVHDGFNVKAIAIYRKINKFDPNSADTLLKLAELYQLQGLSREAREQFLQAAEFFKKRNQLERTLEVLRKLVQLDPQNGNFRNRLAAECEQAGKREEAALAYLEAAETLVRRNDSAGAETALEKAAHLDPRNSKIQLLRARMAVAHQQPEEAEKILNSIPELLTDPAGKQLLLQCYLASRNLSRAEKLVMEVFQANPTDFTPLSRFTLLCLDKGDIDAAFHPLSQVTDQLIQQNNTGPLMESLRLVWTKAPRHIPLLELIYKVCERTADEATLPEVLEGLGKTYLQEGNLEKAEATYQKLCAREPVNEQYRGLLKEVMKKMGKDQPPLHPADIAEAEMVLAPTTGAAPEPAPVDSEQEAMVREALENSDLFSRYNLVEKAVGELEKVLRVYPNQIDLHQRILEICRKGFPERAAAAAATLAKIYTERGDEEAAGKYHAVASAKGALPEVAPPPPSPPPPLAEKAQEKAAPLPESSKAQDKDLTAKFPVSPMAFEKPAEVAPPPPAEAVFDLTPPEPPSAPPVPGSEQTLELDLSGDFEAIAGMVRETTPPPVKEAVAPAEPAVPPAPAEIFQPAPETPAAPVAESAPFDIEDSWVEVNFYIENGFVDEARKAVATLEEKYPGNKSVAELRQHVEERTAPASAGEAAVEVVPEAPAAPSEPEPAAVAEEPATEEWELPSSFAASTAPPPAMEPPSPAPVEKHLQEPLDWPMSPPPAETPTPPHSEPAVEEPAAVESGGRELLDDITGDFASTLDGLTGSDKLAGAGPKAATSTFRASGQVAEQLSGLLAEMDEPGFAGGAAQDDPETHYNLGVAFREMGLLDEAIGEFQKVVKGAGKGHYPANYLQACSLLALCFMDKKMPAIAIKWYHRSLETPGLDEEAALAIQYDMGVAYEQAGDMRSALERFTEVYSQNIDFRDVAEKIRELQHKV
jgi:tetratricopeptide (TPR) repeat protein